MGTAGIAVRKFSWEYTSESNTTEVCFALAGDEGVSPVFFNVLGQLSDHVIFRCMQLRESSWSEEDADGDEPDPQENAHPHS